MEIIFLPQADKDLNYWTKSGNKAMLKRISKLTRAILDNPYTGIGKPEQLKFELAPKWSRRINKNHRYVYLIKDDKLFIFSLKGHYK